MRAQLMLCLLLACKAGAEESGGAAASDRPPVSAAPRAASRAGRAPAAMVEAGQEIPAFEVEGTAFAAGGQPTATAISSQKTERPTAYLFLGTRCRTTSMYLGRIAELEKQYRGKVDFVYLYPNKTDSLEEKKAFHQEHQLRGPLVDDRGAAVAHGLLGGRRTAEVVLADKGGVILYTGAIDDSKDEAKVTRRHFAVAVDEHLAGKPVSQPKTSGSA